MSNKMNKLKVITEISRDELLIQMIQYTSLGVLVASSCYLHALRTYKEKENQNEK